MPLGIASIQLLPSSLSEPLIRIACITSIQLLSPSLDHSHRIVTLASNCFSSSIPTALKFHTLCIPHLAQTGFLSRGRQFALRNHALVALLLASKIGPS